MKLACLGLLATLLVCGETVSQADLETWLSAWQAKQQLREWRISIRFATQKELTDTRGAAVGEVFFPEMWRADIRILEPAENGYVPRSKLRQYTELTTVHELVHVSLHLLVKPEMRSRANDDAENVVVEDIAEALVFGRIPACMTPQKFMEFEIDALPWKPMNAALRADAAGKLAAGFLDGRPRWWQQRYARCADVIRGIFDQSAWR